MIEGLRTPARHRSCVAVTWIVAIVDVAVEAVRAMEPRSGSDEYGPRDPIRTIVAIGCTVVRSIVKVPIRTYRSDSNVYRNLSRSHRHATHHRNNESRKNEPLPS